VGKRSAAWVDSFLEGRKQLVQVGKERSGWLDVKYGCPQGSLLSPLIFTIFTADIGLWVRKASVFGYADDTSSSTSNSCLHTAIKDLEEDANNILDFMASNYLQANPDKMGFLIIREKKYHGTERNTMCGGGNHH
jgi:hypothetical protein